MPTVGNVSVWLNANTALFEANMARASATMSTFSKTAMATGTRVAAVGTAMTGAFTVPAAVIGGLSVKAFADFDQAMTQSLAIMGDISDSMRNEMSQAARDMALNSVFSAKQAAESYFFLASAGLDAKASLAALPVVTDFATSGMFDMARATDLLTDAQSALGMTIRDDAVANMENMQNVSDVLVKANTLANASVEQFSEALTTQAGPAMKAYGIELEDGVAMLAAYADQGIKSHHAGSMMSRALRLMTKAAVDNADTYKALGVRVFDSSGKMRRMHEIVADLTKVLKPLSTEQRVMTLELLGFQARSQQAILPLIGLSDQMKTYRSELKKAGGITQEVAEKQLQSFSNQLKLAWKNIVDASISFGQIFAPMVLKAAQAIARFASWMKSLPDSVKQVIVTVTLVVAAIGPLAIIVGKLIKGIAGLGAVFAWFAANPAIVAVAAVGALSFAFGKLINQLEAVQKAQKWWANLFKMYDKEYQNAITDKQIEAMDLEKKRLQLLKQQKDTVAETGKEMDNQIQAEARRGDTGVLDRAGVEATQFAGAVEKGSVAAYKAEVGMTTVKPIQTVASNTGKSNVILNQILGVLKDTQTDEETTEVIEMVS